MQQVNKPFPPFGAVLNQLIASKCPPDFSIYIFCGKDAWQEARYMNIKHPPALCLPPGKYVHEFEWPVRGLSLILFNTGQMSAGSLRETAYSLLKAGAKQVCMYNGDDTPVAIYHQQI